MEEEILGYYLAFCDFYQFYATRKIIKKALSKKSAAEISIFKWYLYSRSFISGRLKNKMWSYLNNDLSEKELKIIYDSYTKNRQRHKVR